MASAAARPTKVIPDAARRRSAAATSGVKYTRRIGVRSAVHDCVGPGVSMVTCGARACDACTWYTTGLTFSSAYCHGSGTSFGVFQVTPNALVN